MRFGIWLPWWLWLIALPVVLAGYVLYAVFYAFFWLLSRGLAALVDRHRAKALPRAGRHAVR